MNRHMMTAAAIVALAALVSAGCKGSSGPRVATADGGPARAAPSSTASPLPSPAADDGDRAVQFQQCMSQHGVQVDTGSDKGGVAVRVSPGAGNKERSVAAIEACRIYLPGGGERTAPTAQELEEGRRLAACLREHGFPGVSDPDPETGKFTYQSADGQQDGADLKNDPQFRAALETCEGAASPKAGSK